MLALLSKGASLTNVMKVSTRCLPCEVVARCSRPKADAAMSCSKKKKAKAKQRRYQIWIILRKLKQGKVHFERKKNQSQTLIKSLKSWVDSDFLSAPIAIVIFPTKNK